MTARVSVCAAFTLLLGVLGDPAGVGAASARPGAESTRHASLDFCVSGGAPLVGAPVLDAQDRIYFATTDGYLHAFESDGRYRFSYTVQGAPLGSVSLRPGDGTILLGTTRRILYAIGQRGSLQWSFETISPVWSGIEPLDAQNVAFLGLDGFLYALTTTGGARFRVKVPGKPLGELLVSRPGLVWVPLTDGVARLENAWRVTHLPLPTAVETLLLAAPGVVARAGTQVVRYDERGAELARYEADEVGSGARGLVLVNGDRVRALPISPEGASPSKDALEWTLPPAARVSAPPAFDHAGLVVPLEDGRLALGSEDDGEFELVEVTRAPLGRPFFDSTSRRIIVTARDGQVCAVTRPSP